MQKLVRAVCDIGLIASKKVEDAIQLHDRNSQTVANRLDFDATQHGRVRDVVIGVCDDWCMWFVILGEQRL